MDRGWGTAALRKDFTYVAGKTDRPWEHFTGRWEAGLLSRNILQLASLCNLLFPSATLPYLVLPCVTLFAVETRRSRKYQQIVLLPVSYYVLITCYFARQSNRSWQKCLLHQAKQGHAGHRGCVQYVTTPHNTWQQWDNQVRQLRDRRLRRLSRLSKKPRPLRIVDLGSCNGFFALKAAYRPAMSHGVAIDVRLKSEKFYSQAPRSWRGGHWRRLRDSAKNSKEQRSTATCERHQIHCRCRMMRDVAGVAVQHVWI